MTGNHCHRFCA